MLKRLTSWYEGEFIPHKNDPAGGFIRLGGCYKRSFSATVARIIFEFYLKYWQWCVGTLLAVVAIVVHAARH